MHILYRYIKSLVLIENDCGMTTDPDHSLLILDIVHMLIAYCKRCMGNHRVVAELSFQGALKGWELECLTISSVKT